MVRLGQRGVSDIVVVAFMFILMVLSAALLHGFSTGALEAAGDRQRELKAQHLHRTLERATVEPYAVPALEAAAQHLVLEDPESRKTISKDGSITHLIFSFPKVLAWSSTWPMAKITGTILTILLERRVRK